MPQASLLTNNRLTGLYKGLDHHYKDYISNHPEATIDQLHAELNDGMYYYLRQLCQSDNVEFDTLSDDEKQKAYAVVKAYLSASPLFRQGSPYAFQPRAARFDVVFVHHHHYNSYNDDFFFHWWLFTSMPDSTSGDSLAQLMLVLVLVIGLILAMVASYYLVNEMIDSFERICYHEGLFQAGLSFCNVLANLAVSAVLAEAFATAPLINLALAAGVANPVGVAALGVVCLTTIGAAIGYFITNGLTQYALAPPHSQSLYSKNPHRFTLTKAEEDILVAVGIDPIKAKCAIIALREDIGDEAASAFWTNRTPAAQKNLDLIRQLRRGETYTAKVGGMEFDCRYDEAIFRSQIPAAAVIASAPPADDDIIWCGSAVA